MASDHRLAAERHIELADEWANRDNVRDPDFRKHMVNHHLTLAQIHATLAIAGALEALETPLPVIDRGRPR